MEIGKKRKRLQAIHIRDALCDEVFAVWVSEPRVEGVLDALGGLLRLMDGRHRFM